MTWEFGLDCKFNPWFEITLQPALRYPKEEAGQTALAAWSSPAPAVSEHREEDLKSFNSSLGTVISPSAQNIKKMKPRSWMKSWGALKAGSST